MPNRRNASALITQAAYARRIEVSRQIVNRWVHEGRILLHDGLVDPMEADRLLAGHRHPAHDFRRKAKIVTGTNDTMGPGDSASLEKKSYAHDLAPLIESSPRVSVRAR